MNIIQNLDINNINSEIIIFPTPVKDYINIEFSESKNATIKLFTNKGELLYRKVIVNSNISTIDIQSFNIEYFILEVIIDEKAYIYKILKN